MLPWKKIADLVQPKQSFREELRAKIYEQSSQIEQNIFEDFFATVELPKPKLVLKVQREYSLVKQAVRNMRAFIRNFWRTAAILTSGAIAAIVIVPLFSIFSANESIASQSSILRGLSGEFTITRNSVITLPEENQEIFIGDIIQSGKNSGGEIIFFEGTALRLDSQTQIQVTKMYPSPYLFSHGGIQIKLLSGRIWVTTFQKPQGNQEIKIITPNTTITPDRASLDIAYLDGKEQVRVFRNSAIISVSGIVVDGDITLKPEESLTFTPFDEFLPQGDTAVIYTPWIRENQKKDNAYTKEFLNAVSEKMKQQYVLDEMNNTLKTFFEKDPDAKEVEALLNQINTMISLANNPHTTPKIKTESTPTAEATPIIIQKARITNPQTLQKTSNKTSITPTRAPIIQIQDISQQTEIKTTEEKIVQNKEIQQDIQTAEQARQKYLREKYQKASVNFTDQVNAYNFDASRETQANNILEKIPDTKESIILLEIMEKDAPRDVKKYIKRKRIQIIKQQEKAELLRNAPPLLPLESPVETPITEILEEIKEITEPIFFPEE